MSGQPHVQRWRDLPTRQQNPDRMESVTGFITRWRMGAHGTPKSVVHKGERNRETGGVTNNGVNPWISSDLVPGDSIRIGDGPLQDYLMAIDKGMRDTVCHLNEHVGATIVCCDGHEHDSRPTGAVKPPNRRYVRLLAGSEREADIIATAMTTIVADARIRGAAPAVRPELLREYVEDDAGLAYPVVILKFVPVTTGTWLSPADKRAYFKQLPAATKALNAAIERYSTHGEKVHGTPVEEACEPVVFPEKTVRGLVVRPRRARTTLAPLPGFSPDWRRVPPPSVNHLPRAGSSQRLAERQGVGKELARNRGGI